MSVHTFQIIDWYSENADVEDITSDDDNESENSDNSIDYSKYKYKIIVFGKDLDERTYSLQINDFTPYYYVRVPQNFTESDIDTFEMWLKQHLPKEHKNDLIKTTLHKKRKFRGFDNNKKFKFVRMVFKNSIAMKKSIGIFQDKTWDEENKKYINIRPKKIYIPGITDKAFVFELYDNMIDPTIRFIHHAEIKPVGWIKATKCTERIDNLTNCDYNLETNWKNIENVESDDNAKIKIMSYDIECDSSHGDFPVPIKNYLKLAREIVIEYEQRIKSNTVVENNIDFLRDCIKIAFEEGNDYISKVYTKNKKIPTDRQIEKVISKCQDFMEEYNIHSKISEKNETKNKYITKLTTLMKSFPKVQGDKTIQIGCSFVKYGETIPYRNVMLTLKSCEQITNTEVECFTKEKDLLLRFKELILQEDPEIITGYNIESFDTPWLIKRARELKIEEEFTKLSRFTENRVDTKGNKLYCQLQEKQEKSAVGELVTVEFIVIPGRIQLDIYKLVQKGYNLSSYKLDDVSAEFIQGSINNIDYNEDTNQTFIETNNHRGLNIGNFIVIIQKNSYLETKYMEGKKFEIIDIQDNKLVINENIDLDCKQNKCIWCLGKDDVSPQDIFRLQKGNSKDRYIIAKYCMMDVILCIELLLKLELITNSLGVSNVCLIPFDWCIHRGQGVRIISLMTDELRKANFVLPFLYKDGDDNDSYEGAIVLKPHPGIYINEPVAVLDYASLYPNSIIMGNCCHSSICLDKKWQGEEGAERLKKLGYDYLDVSYDSFDIVKSESGAIKSKTKSGIETVRFVQPKDGKEAQVPKTIKKLLKARKTTRKKIIFKTVTTEENVYIGIYDKEKNTVTDVNGSVLSITGEIISVKDTYTEFQKKVLDGLQLGFKVTANSLYGQLGAKVSHLYFKELAASTTAIGRQQLDIAQTFCEDPKNFPKKMNDGSIRYLQNKVVYGDTDSVFVKYECIDGDGNRLLGREARAETIKLAIESEKGIKKRLKAPQDLEYEKTFDPFILFTKKRYVGDKYEHDLDKCKQTSMGIVLKRRDNAPIVKVIFGGIIDIIMKEHRIESSLKFLHDSLEKLMRGDYGLDALIITKTLSSYYKDPDKIAHKVLANRIAERDPGNKPQVNDRIPFVYINVDDKNNKNMLQGDKIETPQFVKEQGLEPDYLHYITNQIQKPVCQIFGLCLEQLPDYKDNTDFDKLRIRFQNEGRTEYDINKKIIEMRQKLAYNVLFSGHIRKLENKKRGNNEITKWFVPVIQNVTQNLASNNEITYESDDEYDI